MVYINHEYKFIFIENAKSGSTSILNALSNSLNIKINRTPHLQNAHKTCDEVKKEVGDEIWKTYFKVTTFRDPVERFKSSANYPRHHELRGIKTFTSLKEHIKNPGSCQYCIPQSEFLKEIDFIIYLNNIQEDYNIFCERIGIPVTKVKIINKNELKVYSESQINELLLLFSK